MGNDEMRTLVGTDIIEVNRIKEAMNNIQFKDRVFTEREIAYCEKGEKTKYQHYAVRFAAKEAVYKAISPILKDKYEISWKNIEIYNDENGRPTVKFIGTNIKNINIDVSMSHIKEYATATAIAVINEGD